MTIDPWGSIRRYTSDLIAGHPYVPSTTCKFCDNSTTNASGTCDVCTGVDDNAALRDDDDLENFSQRSGGWDYCGDP